MDKLSKWTFVIALLVFSTSLYAQQQGGAEISTADLLDSDSIINNVTASTNIKEISLRLFEDSEFWSGKMPLGDGYVRIQPRASAGPQAKTPLPGEAENNLATSEQSILGVNVKYYRRNMGEIDIIPARPIPIEGVVKQISVWVASRNQRHALKIVVQDLAGTRSELYMGTLAFVGWQQLAASVPPWLQQIDYRDPRIKSGLVIEKFVLVSDPEDSHGDFYFYLDDLRARTDLYHVEGFDEVDDPSDNW